MWFVMQLGMLYCYCVKFALTYILTLPFRLVSYLYLGIRYDQPLYEWWLKIRISERVAQLVCHAYASGQTAEEMKELYNEVIEVLERP